MRTASAPGCRACKVVLSLQPHPLRKSSSGFCPLSRSDQLLPGGISWGLCMFSLPFLPHPSDWASKRDTPQKWLVYFCLVYHYLFIFNFQNITVTQYIHGRKKGYIFFPFKFFRYFSSFLIFKVVEKFMIRLFFFLYF